MSTPHQIRDPRRFRLAGNDNETVVTDDEFDTEGHRLAGNDNETVVEGAARRIEPDEADDDPTTLGMRRAARR